MKLARGKAKWENPKYCGILSRRILKREGSRSQRRQNRIEILVQLEELTGKEQTNEFAPIPVFMMGEWERLGMERWRQMKSNANLRKGVRNWKHHQQVFRDADQALEQDLRRTLAKMLNR